MPKTTSLLEVRQYSFNWLTVNQFDFAKEKGQRITPLPFLMILLF
jgi:hypothetical protein